MIKSVSANISPSFGKVTPIKKIVFDDDSTVKYQQQSLDIFNGEDTTNIDNSCGGSTATKTIQALVRILTGNDKAEPNTYQNALNDMIRKTYAFVDKDYKIPSTPVPSTKNQIAKPCYGEYLNYMLTGKEAQEYSITGKKIGSSRALVRDFDAPEEIIDRSKSEFALRKNFILANNQSRLKTPIGTNLGIVIYADKVNIPKKGSKGVKTEINVKGIGFEPI